jgi:hypothetical protein
MDFWQGVRNVACSEVRWGLGKLMHGLQYFEMLG